MDRDEHIRNRAHSIWESEGRPHGRDVEHWQRASRELDGHKGDGLGSEQSPGEVSPSGTLTGSHPPAATPTGRDPKGTTPPDADAGALAGDPVSGLSDIPDRMAVDDLKIDGPGPSDNQPATGRSKLVGS
ncbi:hypothetical protein GCM10008941_13470 [Rhizomicrobium palustre]